jgi:hypothetical protein
MLLGRISDRVDFNSHSQLLLHVWCFRFVGNDQVLIDEEEKPKFFQFLCSAMKTSHRLLN